MSTQLEAFFNKKEARRARFSTLSLTTVNKTFVPVYGRSLKTAMEIFLESSQFEDVKTPEREVEDDAKTASDTTETAQVEEEDPEWLDYKKETAVDITDLKLGALHLQDLLPEEKCEEITEEECLKEEKKMNPWKISEVQEEDEKTIQESICEAVDAGHDMAALKEKARAMNAKALLQQQEQQKLQPTRLPGAGKKKTAAPDLKNSEAFPTLAGANLSNEIKKKERKAGKGAKKESPTSSNNQQGGGYKPPIGRGGADGIYKPPTRDLNGSAGGRESSEAPGSTARGVNGFWSRAGGSGGPSDGAWSRGSDRSDGAWGRGGGRGGENGSARDETWSRGGNNGGNRDGAWGRGGDGGGSRDGAWGRGGDRERSRDGAWGRGGDSGSRGDGARSQGSANSSTSWSSISKTASDAGRSDSGKYQPPSMRNSNRFGALNDTAKY